MNDGFLHIFPLDGLFQPQKEVLTYHLVVELIYKDSGIKETVAFQSLNVFEFISDDVEIVSWRYKCSDGRPLMVGSTLQNLRNYTSNLDKHIKKFEGE